MYEVVWDIRESPAVSVQTEPGVIWAQTWCFLTRTQNWKLTNWTKELESLSSPTFIVVNEIVNNTTGCSDGFMRHTGSAAVRSGCNRLPVHLLKWKSAVRQRVKWACTHLNVCVIGRNSGCRHFNLSGNNEYNHKSVVFVLCQVSSSHSVRTSVLHLKHQVSVMKPQQLLSLSPAAAAG